MTLTSILTCYGCILSLVCTLTFMNTVKLPSLASASTNVVAPTAALGKRSVARAPTAPTVTPMKGPVKFRIIANESKVSYLVRERWLKEEWEETVIGSTSLISGDITLDPALPATARVSPIFVNVVSFGTGDPDRDILVRSKYLESILFPVAVFTPTQWGPLPRQYRMSQTLVFTMSGPLTLRNITRTVMFEVRARLSGNKLAGTATAPLRMTDFDIKPPSKVGISVVADELIVRVEFVARPLASGA